MSESEKEIFYRLDHMILCSVFIFAGFEIIDYYMPNKSSGIYNVGVMALSAYIIRTLRKRELIKAKKELERVVQLNLDHDKGREELKRLRMENRKRQDEISHTKMQSKRRAARNKKNPPPR